MRISTVAWGSGVLWALLALGGSRDASAQSCSPTCSAGYVCQAGTCLASPEAAPPPPPAPPAPSAPPAAAPPAPPAAPAAPAPPAYPPGYYPPGYAPPPPGYVAPAYPPPGYPPGYPTGYPPGYPTAYPPGYGPPPGYPVQAYPPPPPPPPRKPKPGYHLHDGFYLQIALGPMFFSGTSDVATESKSFSAMGGGGQILLGGSLAPGLVLGGGVVGGSVDRDEVLPASLSSNVASLSINGLGNNQNTASLNALSMFVDYYLDPTKGLHLQGSLGLAMLDASSSSYVNDLNLSGLSASAAVGNEWWISDNWSLGVLGRLQYVSMRERDSSSQVTFKAFIPALLLALTYH